MRYWLIVLIAGVLALLGGIFALLNPLAATLTATVLAAWMFILIGGLELFAAFGDVGWGRRVWMALLGLAGIFVGVNILGNPLAGVLALTWLVAILFLVEGVVKIMLALAARGTPYFWMMVLSGLVSVVLAVMILSNFPQSAVTILGILLAIDLISTGVGMIALALHARDIPQTA